MAKVVLPRVHVMVLCDEIEPSSVEEDVFDLRGVRTHIVAPSFPYIHPLLCVYLQMTGHAGTASGHAAVSDPEADAELYVSPELEISFSGPLAFVQESLRLYDCEFQRPGVFYVQVFFDGKIVGERALTLYHGQAAGSNGQQTG